MTTKPTGISPSKRWRVFARDGYQCTYCGRKPPEVPLEIDHVLPRSKGGTDDESNLTTACFDCNRGKWADLTPDQERQFDEWMDRMDVEVDECVQRGDTARVVEIMGGDPRTVEMLRRLQNGELDDEMRAHREKCAKMTEEEWAQSARDVAEYVKWLDATAPARSRQATLRMYRQAFGRSSTG